MKVILNEFRHTKYLDRLGASYYTSTAQTFRSFGPEMTESGVWHFPGFGRLGKTKKSFCPETFLRAELKKHVFNIPAPCSCKLEF